MNGMKKVVDQRNFVGGEFDDRQSVGDVAGERLLQVHVDAAAQRLDGWGTVV